MRPAQQMFFALFASMGLLAQCSGPPFYPPGDSTNYVVPYQHRGMTLGQLEDFLGTYATVSPEGDSSVLSNICGPFNEKNKVHFDLPADDPQLKYPCQPVNPRAYDVVDHLIVPLTDPDRYNDPQLQPAQSSWKVPAPKRITSMSELLNPKGLEVDIFVSWSWQTTIEDVITSLRDQAIQLHKKLNKQSPDEVVFWMCWMAINQHQIRDELHWDLSMAPFRLALENAKYRVLLLNDRWDTTLANEGSYPLGQAWNHFEILTSFTLGKQMWPIGPAVQQPQRSSLQRLLSTYSVDKMNPDKRTGATEGDKKMILELVESSLLGVEGMTKKVKLMVAYAMEWYALVKVANATKVLTSPELNENVWGPWTIPSETGEHLAKISQFVDWSLNKHGQKWGLPECQAAVPQGMHIQLLDDSKIADSQLLMHQTEVVVRCTRQGNNVRELVFRSSCNCPVQEAPTGADCIWSLPRRQGSRSCWPQHMTGAFDCKDQPPLPPVFQHHCFTSGCTSPELEKVVCGATDVIQV